MPEIAVDLGSIEGGSYESLPVGSYLGEIESATYQAAKNEGKFPQMKVTYVVIDGDELGRKQSQWVTLPDPSINREFKAGFRLKDFFGKFGLTEGQIHFDDETDEFDGMVIDGQLEPFSMQSIRVIFKVFPNGKRQDGETRYDAALTSVEDDLAAPVAAVAAQEAAPAAAPAPRAPVARATAAQPGQRRSLR